MKRILTVAVIAVAAMVATFDVSAQTIGFARFGVFGGFTSARTRDAVTNILNYQVNRMPEYHAGITGQIPMGAAFSLQPSIAWHVKGSSLSGLTDLNGDLNYEALTSKLGYLEGGLQLQAGLDLLAFRPYAFVEPFLGYALSVNQQLYTTDPKTPDQTVSAFNQSGLRRFEWGMGVGFGVEVWRMQLAFKWFWNFGQLYDAANTADAAPSVAQAIRGVYENGRNFNGFVLSIGFFIF